MMIIFYTFTERLLGSKSPVSPAWLEDFRACFVVKAYFHNLDFVISHSLYYAGIWSHWNVPQIFMSEIQWMNENFVLLPKSSQVDKLRGISSEKRKYCSEFPTKKIIIQQIWQNYFLKETLGEVPISALIYKYLDESIRLFACCFHPIWGKPLSMCQEHVSNLVFALLWISWIFVWTFN